MATVSIAVCWFTFVAVWLITANYNEGRAAAERRPGFRLVTGRRAPADHGPLAITH